MYFKELTASIYILMLYFNCMHSIYFTIIKHNIPNIYVVFGILLVGN